MKSSMLPQPVGLIKFILHKYHSGERTLLTSFYEISVCVRARARVCVRVYKKMSFVMFLLSMVDSHYIRSLHQKFSTATKDFNEGRKPLA